MKTVETINTNLPPHQKEWLREEAYKKRTSIAKILQGLIDEEMKKQGG